MIAHDSLKYDYGAISGSLELLDYLWRFDPPAHQRIQVILDRGPGRNRAAADWRKKGHLITRGERLAPFRKLLIHGRNHRRTKPGKLRKTPPIAFEQVLDTRAIGKLHQHFRTAHDVLQLPEKQHAHSHGAILSAPKRKFHCPE